MACGRIVLFRFDFEKQGVKYRQKQQRGDGRKEQSAMIVAAIEPNIASPSSGIIPRMVVSEAIITGRRRLWALTTSPAMRSVSPLHRLADFVQQYDAIFNQHAHQSQRTHNGAEVERLSGQQHCSDDADGQ